MEIERLCDNIKVEVDNLKTEIANMVGEDSVSADTLSDVFNHLESIVMDINATKTIMAGNA